MLTKSRIKGVKHIIVVASGKGGVGKSLITSLTASALGTSGTTLIGRTVAGSALKLLPAVGTFAGDAINASSASLLTTALGEAYIKLMVLIANGELSEQYLSSK